MSEYPPGSMSRISSPIPLLFLPPVGLDAGVWRWLDSPFKNSISHEYRTEGIVSLADEADRIVSLLGYGPFHVVGVSMGGMVAQNLVLRHPKTVKSLVLAATSASSNPEIMHERAARVRALGMPAVVDETLWRWFQPAALEMDPSPAPVAYVRAQLLTLHPELFSSGWDAMADHNLERDLHQVSVPTTCVAGTHDVSTPESVVAALRRAIPGAQMRMIQSSHMIPLENAGAFSAILAEHLKNLDGDFKNLHNTTSSTP